MRLLRCGLLLLLLTACTEENPTDIGGPLVPGNTVETFEVFLDASQYLVFDTAFSGYADAFDSGLLVIARNFEGVTNANALVRYAPRPVSIQVRNTSGTVVTDTLPRFPDGQLVIVLDSATSKGTGRINVHRVAEVWESGSATWTVRFDSSGTKLNWRTPGGTRGALIGSAEVRRLADTLLIPLDSALIASFTTAADSSRGALISVENPGPGGARMRIASTFLRVNAKSSLRADTTVVLTLANVGSTFIFSPDPPAQHNAVRVSGVPAWRAILALRDDFKEISVPCPGTGCTVKIKDVHVNRAELMLVPTASPPGFSPEDSVNVMARAVVEGAEIPVARSPVADPIGSMSRAVPAASFVATTTTESPVAVTTIVSALATDTASVGSANRTPRRLALLTDPESATFGFASFRPAPRLRLVLTTVRDR